MGQNCYNIILSERAKKDLLKINPLYLKAVVRMIAELKSNPRRRGSIKLSVSKNSYRIRVDVYRIRVGVYRIIYTIEDRILTVNVVKIDHRSSVYR